MRMWKVDPTRMCDRHLLGEHNEMHMFVGCILKGKSIAGYISGGLVEVHCIRERHEELAREMLRRGFRHMSPLPEFTKSLAGSVDVEKNTIELRERCQRCRF